jgi:hypothetical protein
MDSYTGPIANPKTKIEAIKEASSIFVEWKSFITTGTPGANIDDAKGLE